jgi:hypothetical protein
MVSMDFEGFVDHCSSKRDGWQPGRPVASSFGTDSLLASQSIGFADLARFIQRDRPRRNAIERWDAQLSLSRSPADHVSGVKRAADRTSWNPWRAWVSPILPQNLFAGHM